ncbi:biotin/lipoyl-containing protein [Rhizobium sp. UGM030330-04]|uniref:acetyl-CoA carboxylase biotin carboxyl carrier protein n=1 Tax=Rhizobium sp. UGM030330-04 TaxID=1378077 RepID=UPI000D877900|nr:biotin/lipoyl-containing protein [Rhizobium sp. UGM030330-04]PYG58666.1 biotin carboxyl carrier protein [Rhizobium sp. UGM030330-04]
MKRQPVSISRYSEPGTIADLATHLERNNVSAIEIKTPDGSLKIVAMAGGQAPAGERPIETNKAPVKAGDILARAPMAGIFTAAHPQRPDRAVQAGQSVVKSEIVAFIAVGPVLVPVIAEKAGTVSEIVTEAGALVGYGSPLLKTET